MTEKINEQEEKISYNKGLIIKIAAKEVKYTHVFRAIMECPELIIFTKNVQKFEMLAFKDFDCNRIDFSTATNLEKVGKKCFKNAKNIHWTKVLENAEQELDSFEGAIIVGKEINQEFGL